MARVATHKYVRLAEDVWKTVASRMQADGYRGSFNSYVEGMLLKGLEQEEAHRTEGGADSNLRKLVGELVQAQLKRLAVPEEIEITGHRPQRKKLLDEQRRAG